MVKMASSKVRGEMEQEAYPLGYVEGFRRAENEAGRHFHYPGRLVKTVIQLGRKRVTTGGVPSGYVEDCGESRTTLGTVFTSLLAEEGHYC